MASKFTGTPQYHFCIDDCIRFCDQITTNKDTYTSIFDSPILDKIKDLHDTYGTVFVLALFYNSDATTWYGGTFNLSQMTDKFKDEFITNSSWLKLTFHSYNYSTRYTDPSHDTVSGYTLGNLFEHYELVRNEVIRFAGIESWIDMFPGHFYDGDKTALKRMKDVYGVNILHGNAIQVTNIPYYMNSQQRIVLNNNGAWYDPYEELLVLLRCASIERVVGDLGGTPGQQTMTDYLTNLSTNVNQLLVFESHETYIHNNVTKTLEGYTHSCDWCSTNGYTSKFPDFDEIKPYFNKGYAVSTASPKAYINGGWVSCIPRLYSNGEWTTPTLRTFINKE